MATTIAGMNTEAVRTAPRSPRQNTYMKRTGPQDPPQIFAFVLLAVAGWRTIEHRLTRSTSRYGATAPALLEAPE